MKMADAQDLVGTSIPFASGIALGSILCASVTAVPVFLPETLSIAIPALILAASAKFDSRTPETLTRLAIASLFILAGIFCSLNSAIADGITTCRGSFGAFMDRCALGIKGRIDSIPYPSGTTGPLVKALLTGDRSGLSKETIGIFRSSGAAHILALSGLHLGVIYLILTYLSKPFGNGPKAGILRYSFIVGTSGFYTVMTGASPSIVRAFLFIVVGETARLLGRERRPSMVLLAALTLQLAIDPGVLSSLGFQLSYLAMAGITFLYPGLERIYPEAEGRLGRLDPMRRLWQAAMLSISCQVFTAPLAWMRFHTFPKYFLLTNLIALPLTSAAMVLSVAVVALSCLGICPDVLVILDDKAVGILVYCLEIISSM